MRWASSHLILGSWNRSESLAVFSCSWSLCKGLLVGAEARLIHSVLAISEGLTPSALFSSACRRAVRSLSSSQRGRCFFPVPIVLASRVGVVVRQNPISPRRKSWNGGSRVSGIGFGSGDRRGEHEPQLYGGYNLSAITQSSHTSTDIHQPTIHHPVMNDGHPM
jgi:hypothetical protein